MSVFYSDLPGILLLHLLLHSTVKRRRGKNVVTVGARHLYSLRLQNSRNFHCAVTQFGKLPYF